MNPVLATERSAEGRPAPAVPQPLVVAFVAGDRAAFRAMFEALGGSLCAVAARYFQSPFDQEEALQEVWLQLHRARGSFDVNRWGAFAGWARQVARNRCLDLLKARKRKRTHEVPLPAVELAAEPEAGGVDESKQEQAVFERRVRNALAELVGRLDEEQRRFFRLCFVEELPHGEIGQRMEITVRRSKYLKKRLLAQMVACAPLREMGRSR